MRKLIKIFTKNTRDIEGLVTWEVRWLGGKATCFDDDWLYLKEYVEVFTNKDSAKGFANQLTRALKLVRAEQLINTISIKENKNTGLKE